MGATSRTLQGDMGLEKFLAMKSKSGQPCARECEMETFEKVHAAACAESIEDGTQGACY
jgi:hypothetical protein